MNVGQIGHHFNITQINYFSDDTFLEYDMILVDLDFIWKARENDFHRLNQPLMEKRKADFADFVVHKNIPIISFLPTVGFRGQSSGEFLPFLGTLIGEESVQTKSESGKIIEVVPRTIFTDLLTEYKDYFFYKSVLNEKISGAIAKTPYKDGTLSYYNQNFVFLPQLKITINPLTNEFLQKLYAAAKQVRNPTTQAVLPAWTSQYYLPQESKMIEKQNQLQAHITKLQEEAEEQEQRIKEKEAFKTLFTETGDPLEEVVLKLFLDLGADAKKGRPAKEDGVLEFEGRTAVWEVKGISGSATIAHSRQLVSWSQEYAPDADEDTKGILIVNAFREQELEQRKLPTFPHNVIDHATKNENCLITTLQLLGLYYECKENPETKEALIQSLFDTVGVYKGFEDWKGFITYQKDPFAGRKELEAEANADQQNSS